MTSKKHYKVVAEMVKSKLQAERNGRASPAALEALESVAVSLAYIFEQDNPNFRRGTFLAACGIIGTDN